ncbi:hypothetical protein Mapa_014563 [Marchantia paleacea]|nr:hypothetical protein Mapa_014563 [Marchantia paleacea]
MHLLSPYLQQQQKSRAQGKQINLHCFGRFLLASPRCAPPPGCGQCKLAAVHQR